MKKIIYSVFLSIGALTFTACELDLQESPNVLTPDKSDPDFLLNGIELQFADFFWRTSDDGAEVMRMENLFVTTWESAFAATDFDAQWQDAYADIMIESKELQEIAVASEFYHHAAIAQTIEAYVLMTLVDYFGDVPYSEALDANNIAPNADNGSTLYDVALDLLNQAKANFQLTPLAGADDDLIYGGDEDLWMKAINSLQLRLHLQRRLVDPTGSVSAINAILAEDNLIDDDAEAFIFQYGTQFQAPNSQHPYYDGNYTGGGVEYMSNYYMNLMMTDKSNPDPRMRYYFYRQDIDETTDVTLRECIGASPPAWYGPNDTFCAIGNGYWGRDHLDNAGIPPDTQLRTTYGAYPAGGLYDNDQDVLVAQGDGLGGAGIHPIVMPSFVDFMKAEAALTIGTTGDPRALLESGIRASFRYVRNFVAGNATNADVDNYVNDALAQYDAAANDDERLNIIIKEYYVSLWGNGIDAYNTYRRTGKPENLQPALRIANPGKFYRSFTYPASYVNRNGNATQKPDNAVQVFWDNNPAGFVD